MSVLSSVIGATSALGGSVGNVISNRKAQRRAYNYGEMSAENAYARQLDFWNRINDYNLPSNEVQRLRDAGLSPGLYYGGAGTGGSAATSTSAPQGSGSSGAQSVDFGPVSSQITQSLALRAQQAQIENIEADTESKRASADNTRRDTELSDYRQALLESQAAVNSEVVSNTRARTIGQELSNSLAESTLPNNVSLASQEVAKNEALLKQYALALERGTLDYNFQRESYDDRLQIISQDLNLKLSSIALQWVQLEALKHGITLTDAQVDQVRSEIDLNLARERGVNSSILTDVAERSNLRLRGKLLQKDLQWYTSDKVDRFYRERDTFTRQVSRKLNLGF